MKKQYLVLTPIKRPLRIELGPALQQFGKVIHHRANTDEAMPDRRREGLNARQDLQFLEGIASVLGFHYGQDVVHLVANNDLVKVEIVSENES